MSSIIKSLTKKFSPNSSIQDAQANFDLVSDLVLFFDKSASLLWFNQSFDTFQKQYSLDNLNEFIADDLIQEAYNNSDTVYEFDFSFGLLIFKAKFFPLKADKTANTLVLICTRDHKYTLYNLKYVDPLTEVGNRALYIKQLDDFYQKQAVNPQLKMILLDLDFKNFNRIDHFYGHEVGDTIIKNFAQQLKSLKTGNIVCRTACTNLIVMHTFSDDNFDINAYIQEITDVFDSPIHIDESNTIDILTNIGAAILPKDAKDKNEALRHVIMAYDQSKKQYERVSVAFYQEDWSDKTAQFFEIEKKLGKAIENNCLELYYQPKIDVKTQQIYAFEALLRWYDDELGFVSPADFIAVAEDTGQIVEIGLWVLYQVCMQSNEWQKRGLRLKVSLNVSIGQLQDPNCISLFRYIINKTEVDTSFIEFEITESILSESLQETVELFNQIKQLGVSISLDDFGTSYSSLSYLKNLPIDILKIDRSFIRYCCDDTKDAAIVKTIVTLAKELKLKVIAEGVETEDQLHLLQYMECDYIQGYYYYKPMCLTDIEAILSEID